MFDSVLSQVCLALLALFTILGLFYLFYPAIVAARTQDESRKVQPVVVAETTSQSKKPILSVIVPAYNEEERIPKMLQEAFTYLSKPNCQALNDLQSCVNAPGKSNAPAVVEWIVVNDGSNDRTSHVYKDFVSKLQKQSDQQTITTIMNWKLIPFPVNAGKGAAVQAGMLAAKGEFCLMVDADGATEFEPGLEALSSKLIECNKSDGSTVILFGSRAHLQNGGDSDSGGSRSFIRSLLAELFHKFAAVFVGATDIRDTQCGFKLLPATVAYHVFDLLHLRRWAFDTELVFLANDLGYPVREVDVPWHEVDGSHLHTSALNLALVSISMLRDMVCVRLCYTLGLWKIRRKQD